jgi:hypothetical protein
MPEPDFSLAELLSIERWVSNPIPPRLRRKNAPIQMDDTPIKVRGDTLGTIWWRGRQWAVTADGIERLDGTYFIAAARLVEDIEGYGWPAHICEKLWADTEGA